MDKKGFTLAEVTLAVCELLRTLRICHPEDVRRTDVKISKQQFIKSGFTLAEVLITLAIIGVIASLVIPNLVTNTQNQELRSKFLKIYSDLSQVNNMMKLNNGGTIEGITREVPDPDYPEETMIDEDSFSNEIARYLSYSKRCTRDNTPDCGYNKVVHKVDGEDYNIYLSWGNFILNNGAIIQIWLLGGWGDTKCDSGGLNIHACARLVIDVNGERGPNQFGRDIFQVWMTNDGLKPLGTLGDDVGNDCIPGVVTSVGFGCAARILKNENY